MSVQKPAMRLVDRVVDDFEDQMVQAALGGVADVHAGTLAHRLETLEDLDHFRPVIARRRAYLRLVFLLRHPAFHAPFVIRARLAQTEV